MHNKGTDGEGKAVRPCLALCVSQLANCHMRSMEEQGDTARRLKIVAIVSEMIYTAFSMMRSERFEIFKFYWELKTTSLIQV